MNRFLALFADAKAMLIVFRNKPVVIAIGSGTPSQKKSGTTMKAAPTPATVKKVENPSTIKAGKAIADISR